MSRWRPSPPTLAVKISPSFLEPTRLVLLSVQVLLSIIFQIFFSFFLGAILSVPDTDTDNRQQLSVIRYNIILAIRSHAHPSAWPATLSGCLWRPPCGRLYDRSRERPKHISFHLILIIVTVIVNFFISSSSLYICQPKRGHHVAQRHKRPKHIFIII